MTVRLAGSAQTGLLKRAISTLKDCLDEMQFAQPDDSHRRVTSGNTVVLSPGSEDSESDLQHLNTLIETLRDAIYSASNKILEYERQIAYLQEQRTELFVDAARSPFWYHNHLFQAASAVSVSPNVNPRLQQPVYLDYGGCPSSDSDSPLVPPEVLVSPVGWAHQLHLQKLPQKRFDLKKLDPFDWLIDLPSLSTRETTTTTTGKPTEPRKKFSLPGRIKRCFNLLRRQVHTT